jgi:pyridoxine/pyridoxamine 5'-phosphate oxidase
MISPQASAAVPERHLNASRAGHRFLFPPRSVYTGMDITLNDVAREVLDGPHIAATATSNTDGRPQSSVIFVRRDGDSVVFSTIKGRLKTRNMARDPRVSLLVIDKEKGRYAVAAPSCTTAISGQS